MNCRKINAYYSDPVKRVTIIYEQNSRILCIMLIILSKRTGIETEDMLRSSREIKSLLEEYLAFFNFAE